LAGEKSRKKAKYSQKFTQMRTKDARQGRLSDSVFGPRAANWGVFGDRGGIL